MATLALCMIVKNEEDTLGNLLSGIDGIFDEIIVVDTGSSDGTAALAEKYGGRVYRYEWNDDFAAARNFSFSLASSDYVMWLDADDVLLPGDAEKLKALKKSLDGAVREIAARYDVGFDESGGVTFSYCRERIFLRAAGFKWSGRVHEAIPLERDCVYADFAVTHRKIHPAEKGRNLRIFEKMKAGDEAFDARSAFYYARELYYNGRVDDARRELAGFLSRGDGSIENKINACALLGSIAGQKSESPLPYLFRSFEYGVPRAEICCEAGRYFAETGRYAEAIYWYEEALGKKPDALSGAFIMQDCYGFIPYIELCVLYYAIGDTQKAVLMNEKAAELKPCHSSVLRNKAFFGGLTKT